MSNKVEGFKMSEYEAAPGFVIIEPIQDKGERKSEGGIIIAEDCTKNASIVARAIVVSSGEFITGRADRCLRDKGWLKAGTEIQYIPCECWTLRGTDGKTLLAIRSQYVLTVPVYKPNKK